MPRFIELKDRDKRVLIDLDTVVRVFESHDTPVVIVHFTDGTVCQFHDPDGYDTVSTLLKTTREFLPYAPPGTYACPYCGKIALTTRQILAHTEICPKRPVDSEEAPE